MDINNTSDAARSKPSKNKKNKKKSRPQSVVAIDASTSTSINPNYSVSATTSKPRPPLPPNQNKKVNNKKQRQKERRLRTSTSTSTGQEKIPNRLDTPISTSSSDSSVARVLMTNMNLDDFTGIEYSETEAESDAGTTEIQHYNYSDSDDLMTGDYTDLPTDDLLLNTESVDKIIEQIVTDIEELSSDNSDSDSDGENEFGEEDANAGVKRYFIENSGPKCFNCGQSGHVVRDCPVDSTVPCHLCGQIGHSRYNCPQEVCYNCSRPGHQSKACPSRRKRRVYDDDLCNRCGQPGHLSRECSMSWRGYIFSRDLPQKQSTFLEELRGLRKRCYNCASISHFGDDCPNRRRSNYSTFHIPQYDYLDRVILRVKRDRTPAHTSTTTTVAATSSSGTKKDKSTKTTDKPTLKASEPPIKVKPERPSKKSGSREEAYQHHYTTQNRTYNSNTDSSNQNRKVFIESRGHASTKNRNDFDHDFSVYDDYQKQQQQQQHRRAMSSHPQNQSPLKRHKEGDEEEEAVPFLRYEQNHVRVNRRINDGEEETLRKGSSSKKQNFSKPSYRGGYK